MAAGLTLRTVHSAAENLHSVEIFDSTVNIAQCRIQCQVCCQATSIFSGVGTNESASTIGDKEKIDFKLGPLPLRSRTHAFCALRMYLYSTLNPNQRSHSYHRQPQKKYTHTCAHTHTYVVIHIVIILLFFPFILYNTVKRICTAERAPSGVFVI